MLLLSLIGGYWLLERAENHKGELRRIGRLLGSLIIVLGLFGLIAGAWGACSWKKDGWSRPFGKGMHKTHQSGMETETIVVKPDVKKRR